MIRRLLIASVVAGLCACSPAAEKAAPPAAPAAPVAQGGDWYVTIAPEGHVLDFRATAEAQTSAVSFTCAPGTGGVTVAGITEPATLAAGGVTQTFAPNAAARLDDPLFQALRSSGALQVTQKGAARTLTGSTEGQFAIKDFFQFCTNPSN